MAIPTATVMSRGVKSEKSRVPTPNGITTSVAIAIPIVVLHPLPCFGSVRLPMWKKYNKSRQRKRSPDKINPFARAKERYRNSQW